MKIVVLKETAAHERRVALSPDVAKKFIESGHQVYIEKNAGKESGFLNEDYENAGCVSEKEKSKLLDKADVFLTVSPLSESDIGKIPENSIVIGMLKPYQNKPLLKKLATKKITSFSLELLPRITRAQTMDVLSSQSNLSGYKAVVKAAFLFGRPFPLMMTAAGTVPAARVLVLGAGVAGLQAIATARRLGAIVSAFDVRTAAKEQVESLGATFISVDSTETGDGSGGYASEMGDDYKKAQAQKLLDTLKTQDIVITTAQIPGKPAPILITDEMLKNMKPDSIIIDLATETGGNCVGAEHGKTVVKHDVKIVGPFNMPSLVANSASQLYARNLLNFFKILQPNDTAPITINWDDEIIKSTALTHQGAIVHPNFKE
ncbi:MAG: Re/Si-specific NAD(P)(+) transhydrogenase subunit alpha [Alphaproteobacteria bacterium]|nr:Re/Si-specific NAD(P)(+) transhydrogenase subunit alpha [Alphaproteobacteria bacterium]